jgi:hypothetical protein
MTPATIKAVVDEIAAYGRSERDEPLSWAALTKFSGFSRVSLWAKPTIRDAFQKAQEALRSDATPAIKAPRTIDERILAMQRTIEELRTTIRVYDEQWARYEYNMRRLGYDPDELRRPLDPLARDLLRSRRSKAMNSRQ